MVSELSLSPLFQDSFCRSGQFAREFGFSLLSFIHANSEVFKTSREAVRMGAHCNSTTFSGTKPLIEVVLGLKNDGGRDRVHKNLQRLK